MSFLKVFLLLLSSLAFSMAAGSRSARDGVFTKAQATRGQAAYREDCAKCHSENLAGGESSPSLVGDEFIKKWYGKTANDLFELTRKTMPADDPGHLSRRQYTDLLAYMLSANDYPAGEKELDSSAEALSDIRIEARK
jgi:mono/diheme cytochrome c family protein